MNSNDDSEFINPSIQGKMREMEATRCQNASVLVSGWCPETWDEIMCWPSTEANQTAVLPCPYYIAGFDLLANATKQCMANGEWYWSSATNSSWSNYTQCYRTQLVTVLMDVPDMHVEYTVTLKKYVPIVKIISKLGYAMSLLTLIVAFTILAVIKKLRCPRNTLHMHLFVSFMMRAFMALLKDILFVFGIGLSSEIVIKDGESYWLRDTAENSWHCKMFTSFWQYSLLANYSWIFMEGLYLHNLVMYALFTDVSTRICKYVILGWGAPALFILPWVIARISLEDTYCWTTNLNPFLFLLIRIPTVTSIVINFFLFLNIVRILLVKLRSSVSEETQWYKKWARSTLVLVPLFGVHYAIFLGMTYSIGINETVEILWLFCDQTFASFQGCVVAILYCFTNAEVRSELKQCWRSRKCLRFRGKRKPRPTQHLSSNCTCKEDHERSKLARCWEKCWPCFSHDRDTHRSTDSTASIQDTGTRGCSLASSRGYLEIAGTTTNGSQSLTNRLTNSNSHLSNKYIDQSLLSLYSNGSETFAGVTIRDRHRWSDSEYCHLAYELENFHSNENQ
ncbi:vasoactive intestinal polypeptide receptor 2-like [Prorops nasuta]|uniref:vasoactive intestinal polypeptide receptor 2-like n=1 Tax=Prorops nasuta TaxID=863751 RepID=UPI0034CD6AB6